MRPENLLTFPVAAQNLVARPAACRAGSGKSTSLDPTVNGALGDLVVLGHVSAAPLLAFLGSGQFNCAVGRFSEHIICADSGTSVSHGYNGEVTGAGVPPIQII